MLHFFLCLHRGTKADSWKTHNINYFLTLYNKNLVCGDTWKQFNFFNWNLLITQFHSCIHGVWKVLYGCYAMFWILLSFRSYIVNKTVNGCSRCSFVRTVWLRSPIRFAVVFICFAQYFRVLLFYDASEQ